MDRITIIQSTLLGNKVWYKDIGRKRHPVLLANINIKNKERIMVSIVKANY